MVDPALRTIAVVLAAAAVLAFLPAADGVELPHDTPHSHFQAAVSCPRCHLPGPGGRPDPARFSPEADTFCLGCHRGESLGRSHPTGVRPAERYGKEKIPPALRLAGDGRMMCLTCHAAHGPYLSAVPAYPDQPPEDLANAGGSRYRTFFLRRTDPEGGSVSLCGSCHRMPR